MSREFILFPRRTSCRHASIGGSLDEAYEDVGAYRLRRSIHHRGTLRVEGPWLRSRLSSTPVSRVHARRRPGLHPPASADQRRIVFTVRLPYPPGHLQELAGHAASGQTLPDALFQKPLVHLLKGVAISFPNGLLRGAAGHVLEPPVVLFLGQLSLPSGISRLPPPQAQPG